MLKQFLCLLLSKFYSKQENELIGHQALPSSQRVTLFTDKSVGDWGTVAQGVAAFDGYLNLTANGTQSGASLVLGTSCLTSCLLYPFATAGANSWVPIAKGDSWRVVGSFSTNISLSLCRTIGGGYKRLIQLVRRASICLSPSSNCLQKRFSRVDTKTLPFKSEGKTRAKSLLLLQTLLNGAIQLRHQVTLPFVFRRLKIRGSELIMSLQECPISQITTGHGSSQRFQSKKETLSFSGYLPKLMFQRLRAGLFLVFVNLKLNKGGATC